ncbi:BLUF domain-containing protein [Vibrio pectenicida]|uniref:BLUF domain-containing protein n=1 Tax=Vibrio pectenicida TaxID=62763 RepID=A0A7Y4EDY5_9VIBR|nr:BLUF domain-containing protein [Vibrio pectenicida]NOH70897.1 BLUF domain-containing protein [Vibrio pectenicida]
MKLIELVYVSKARNRLEQDELEGILSKARKNNTDHDITGLLLYDGYGTFIQVLEGPEPSVERLFEKIKTDSRHSGVNRIGFHQINSRSFSDWKMGFRVLDQDLESSIPGYSDFMKHRGEVQYLVEHKSFAMQMVHYFVKKD